MYNQPPLVASDPGTALAAGNVTTTLVAAPGAGFAIRVVGVNAGINRLSTGIVDVTVNGVPWRCLGLQLTGRSGDQWTLPEPGVQLAANTALSVTYSSSAAAGTGFAVVLYYIDSVS